MRVLRTTVWRPDGTPFTVIITEKNLAVPIYTAANMRREFAGASALDMDIEVEEVDDSLSEADVALNMGAVRGVVRQSESTRHRLTLRYWLLHVFSERQEPTIVQTTMRSPLTKEEIEEELRYVAQQPEYNGQRVHLYDMSGTPVTLAQGTVTVG